MTEPTKIIAALMEGKRSEIFQTENNYTEQSMVGRVSRCSCNDSLNTGEPEVDSDIE
jgi:hypothetical protein